MPKLPETFQCSVCCPTTTTTTAAPTTTVRPTTTANPNTTTANPNTTTVGPTQPPEPSTTPPPKQICECCNKSTGCQCITIDPDGDNENLHGFSYGNPLIWINYDWPKPMFESPWDSLTNRYIENDPTTGRIYTQYNSRPGMGISGATSITNFTVINASNPIHSSVGLGPNQIVSQTICNIEERFDRIKKECQLWIRYRTYSFNFTNYAYEPIEDWSDFEKIDSIKRNVPFVTSKVVTISGSKFTGGVTNGSPSSVELIYRCNDYCSFVQNNPVKTLTLSGQASYIKSEIQYPRTDICESFGSYESTGTFLYKSCDLEDLVLLSKGEVVHAPEINPYYYFCGAGASFIVEGQKCTIDPDCSPANSIHCCPYTYGTYLKDGSCLYNYSIGSVSYFIADKFNVEIINEKQVIVKGTWSNATTESKSTYDCSTFIGNSTPAIEYAFGSITVTVP